MHIDQKFNILMNNLQQVRDSQAALSVDETGALVDAADFKGRVAEAPEARIKDSIKNVVKLVKKLEVQGLDAELKKTVEKKLDSELPVDNTRLTKADFEKLHTLIRDKIVLPRMQREAAEKITAREATPTMENATDRGLRVAIKALEEGMEGEAMPYRQSEIGTRPHGDTGIVIAPKRSGPEEPVNIAFVEKVCGKAHDEKKLRRDMWDANKILGELKLAEKHIKDSAEVPGESTEITSAKVAALKSNLLAALKASLSEKQVQSNLSKVAAGGVAKPQAREKRLGFAEAAEVKQVDIHCLDPRLAINDENRVEWVHDIETLLGRDDNAQAPYQVAETLRDRVALGKDDGETLKAIGLLRMHPAFIRPENFGTLRMNLLAAAKEHRDNPAKFPNAVKQHYRENADAIKALAQQQLDALPHEFIADLRRYRRGIERLKHEDNPERRAAKLKELDTLLDKHEVQLAPYKDVFEDPDKTLMVKGGKTKVEYWDEALIKEEAKKEDATSVLEYLSDTSLFAEGADDEVLGND